MAKFIGDKCIVCGEEFKSENDDIVVCPECGTPYHRECYAKYGKCINNELHESGEAWKSEKEKRIDEQENKKCPYCGFMNKPQGLICERCGTPLVEDLKNGMPEQKNIRENAGGYDRIFIFDLKDKCCGMNPDEEFESVKLQELADFVKKNQLYYLPIFKKIKDTGQKISFNIVSFFVPELYFANRKMWFWSAFSIFLTTLLSIPSVIYFLYDNGVMNGILGSINIESHGFELIFKISSYVNFIFKLLTLLFANWLYYKHALNKINRQKALKNSANPDRLSAAGGTSFTGVLISFAIESFLLTLIMFLLIKQ